MTFKVMRIITFSTTLMSDDFSLAIVVANAKQIMMHYPNVAQACTTGGVAVVHKLKSAGVLDGVHVKGMIDIPQGGDDDGIQAWRNFQQEVKKFMKSSCAQHEAAYAISDQLSDWVVKEYLKKYPRWPAANKSQKAQIVIHENFRNEEDPTMEYYALATGQVQIKDSRRGTRYTAHVNGNLSTRVLSMKKQQMKLLEQQIQERGVSRFVEKCQSDYNALNSSGFTQLLTF